MSYSVLGEQNIQAATELVKFVWQNVQTNSPTAFKPQKENTRYKKMTKRSRDLNNSDKSEDDPRVMWISTRGRCETEKAQF